MCNSRRGRASSVGGLPGYLTARAFGSMVSPTPFEKTTGSLFGFLALVNPSNFKEGFFNTSRYRKTRADSA